MKTKEKIVNFRSIFFCFVSFFCAIIFAHNILSGNIYYISFFAVVFLILLILSIFRKQLKKLLLIFFTFCIGLGFFAIELSMFNGKVYNEPCHIQGQIETINNNKSIFLKNVKINNNSDKNVCVYLSSTQDLDIGQIISFDANINNTLLFELNKFDSTSYKHQLSYFVNISRNDITIESNGRLNFVQKIQNKVRNILYDNTSQENAGLFYGILFGDKSELDHELKESYRTSGIAHLLAVSGLHVGVFVSLLSFVLGKFKISQKINLLINFIVLFLYCCLCSFSPSVVRASLMTIIGLFAITSGRQYDFVNSISLAGLIILIFSPLSAYDIGFQLSFLCVYSIAFILPLTSKLLCKIKIPKSIGYTLAVTLATQIGLLPLTAYYFGEVSLLSILTNFFCIPIFQVGFILLIIITLLCIPFSFLGFLYIPVHYIFELISTIAMFVTSQSFFTVTLYSLNFVGILCYFIGVFVFSKFVNVKKIIKYSVSLGLIVTVVIYSLIMSLPKQHENLTIYQYSTNCHIIVSRNNQTLMISQTNSVYYNFTNRININKIDYLIGTNISDTNDLEDFYQIKDKSIFGYDTVLGDFKVEYIKLINKINYIKLQVDGYTICYMLSSLTAPELELFNDLNNKTNIVINGSTQTLQTGDYHLSGRGLQYLDDIYVINNYAIDIKNGKLKKLWSLN